MHRGDKSLPRRWAIGSLEGKFTLLMVVIVLFVVGSFTYLANRLSVAAAERDSLDVALEVAESLARSFQVGFPENDRLKQNLAEQVHSNPEIESIAVFEFSSSKPVSPLASVGIVGKHWPEQQLAAAERRSVSRRIFREGRRFWSVAVPVLASDHVFGVVGVWSSLQAADVVIQQSRRRFFLIAPLSMTLMVVLLRLVFNRLVHKPVLELERAMADVEAGNFQSDARVFRRDELGFVALRYNRMLARIRTAAEEREKLFEQIRGLNEELAEKVSEATAELQEKNRELQGLNEALYYLQRRLALIERLSGAQQMAANFAHKIGTPLNLISGHIQVLQQSREGDSELQEKLQLISSQVEKLTAIICTILDETRKPDLALDLVDLNPLLERILALIEPTLSARGVTVEKHLHPEIAAVAGDSVQLEQVFLSLLNNSLDAMVEGGTITVETEEVDNKLRIRFSDTGEGIPEGVMAQIFRPFFTTKEIGRGTGLGLSIAKEILTAHGASIEADSVLGRGTTFLLTFPSASKQEERAS